MFRVPNSRRLQIILQVQVNLQANHPQPEVYHDDEDVETALTDLQVTLEGTLISKGKANITNVPELSDYLSFMKFVSILFFFFCKNDLKKILFYFGDIVTFWHELLTF